ncbi:hypothetical protein BRARA_F03399 [Brassica rapa]|uniref:Uncharacterized protein n=1 Tax=Brassica campestris TaxID=3711 RepID=A0A397Z5H7_BRACM|nr:hypothetical protein BRARA_F03399 [Brassica rapa]
MKVSNLWLLISPNIQNKNTSVCYIVMSRICCDMVHLAHHPELKQYEKIYVLDRELVVKW